MVIFMAVVAYCQFMAMFLLSYITLLALKKTSVNNGTLLLDFHSFNNEFNIFLCF